MVTRKEIEILRFLTLLSLFLVFLGGVAIPDAKAQSFSYRMSVTVNASQVQNGPLSNFPFLFSSTNNNLRTTVNGGHVTNANGYDIIFRAVDPTTCGAAWDGNGCTLSYEIETYDGTNGTFIAWVKVPSINNGTVIYIYYGNSSVTTSQENKTGVWDSNYLAVWHLPNGSSLTTNDSTSNANNGANQGASATTGQVDGAGSFNGTSNYISTASAVLSGNTQFTISEWVKTTSVNYMETVGQYYGVAYGAFEMWMPGGTNNNMRIYAYYGGGSYVTRDSSSNANDGNWHLWTGVYNGGTGNLDIYCDGVLKNGTLTGTVPSSIQPSTIPLYIGAYSSSGTPAGFFSDSLDEVRISNIARSADWIKTEYNNQSSPSGFYALGTEGSPPSTSYGYRISVTVNSNQVQNGPLTNFPFLFSSTSNNLRTTVNGGHVTNGNGYDIIFRALDATTCGAAWNGSSCTLSHEIEKYDGSAGTFIAWVKVPSIQSTTPATVIYVYYGNSSVISSQENKTDVWDSNYTGVWHLGPGSGTLDVTDSTNTHNGTNQGATATAGEVDGGGNFVHASSQYISTGKPLSAFISASDATIEAWVKPSGSAPAETVFWYGDGIVGDEDGYMGLYWENYSGGGDKLYAYNYDGTHGVTIVGTTYTAGQFIHLVEVHTGGKLYLYANGSLVGSTDSDDTGGLTYNLDIGAGYNYNISASIYFNGVIDEVRISSIARSADWIKTEYNNQSSPSGFYALGTESSSPPTVVFLASFSAQAEGGGVLVEWVTKTEIDNVGFNLYRNTGTDGTYLKLNPEMIAGLLSSVNGRAYTFYDEDVTPGKVYCYQLEDIDLQGKRTMHGPVCVDWSAAGSGGGVPSGSVTSGGRSQSSPAGGSSGSAGKAGSGSSSGSNAVNSNSFVNGMNGTTKVTQVGMRDLRATWTDGEVLVEWSTGYEVNNLGFHVYREEGGQLLRLTPDLVAGSALRYRAGTLTAGYSYSWLDVSPLHSALSTDRYWLEDVDLSGKKTWHGPVSPVFSDQPLPRKSQSALLSQLARMQAQADPESSRIQALQTRLGKNRRSALRTQNSSFSPQSSIDGNIEVQGVDDGTGGFIGGVIPSIISDRPPKNPIDLQWGLAASQGVKIYIQQEGWYRITQPELMAAGLSASVDPRYLRLFVDGQEQAIGVSASVGNQFGPQDFVEFYATGLDTPFTDTRVYWLISGSTPGQRIQQVGSSTGAGGQVTSTSFPFTVVDKPRTLYFAALLNGDASNIFGPLVATAPTQQVLSVQHLDPAAPGGATLEVTLQGVTVSPHQVQISLNGVVVGALNFSDQTEGSTTVSLSPGGLQEGDNVVQLTALGGDMDLSLIDTLRLTYWHTYTADNDILRLTAVGGTPLGVDGFSSSQIRVMDITDPQAVQEVLGSVQSQGAGYSIQLEVPGSGTRTLWAFAGSQVGKPAAHGGEPAV